MPRPATLRPRAAIESGSYREEKVHTNTRKSDFYLKKVGCTLLNIRRGRRWRQSICSRARATAKKNATRQEALRDPSLPRQSRGRRVGAGASVRTLGREPMAAEGHATSGAHESASVRGAPAWTGMTCVRNSQRGLRLEAGMGPAVNVLAPFSLAQHSPSSGTSMYNTAPQCCSPLQHHGYAPTWLTRG
jgi:hypothetical protein